MLTITGGSNESRDLTGFLPGLTTAILPRQASLTSGSTVRALIRVSFPGTRQPSSHMARKCHGLCMGRSGWSPRTSLAGCAQRKVGREEMKGVVALGPRRKPAMTGWHLLGPYQAEQPGPVARDWWPEVEMVTGVRQEALQVGCGRGCFIKLLTEDLCDFHLLPQQVARFKINSRRSTSNPQTSILRPQASPWHNCSICKVYLQYFRSHLKCPLPLPGSPPPAPRPLALPYCPGTSVPANPRPPGLGPAPSGPFSLLLAPNPQREPWKRTQGGGLTA